MGLYFKLRLIQLNNLFRELHRALYAMASIPPCPNVVQVPIFAGIHHPYNVPCVIPHATLQNTIAQLRRTPGGLHGVNQSVGRVVCDINSGCTAVIVELL